MKVFRGGPGCKASGLLALAFLLHAQFAFAQPPPALLPPRDEIIPTFWERYGWPIVIVFVACVLVAGVMALLLTRQTAKLSMPPEALARYCLSTLRGRKVDGPLLMEISRIFRRYLIFAFDLPAQEATTAELSQLLQSSAKADPSLASSIVRFLRECDEDKFSPNNSPPHTDPATRALGLLEQIEVHRRRLQSQAIAV